jgi:transcription elongation GreA/GreB family factor
MTIGHDARHALIEELGLLRERRREVEESFGDDDRPHDAGELSDATQRRDELDWITLRIRDISYLLHAAGEGKAPPGRVGIGSVVTLRYPDGQLESVQVTAIPDEDIPATTPESPLGQALLGARPGERVSWWAPEGRLTATVEDVRAQRT